MKKISQILIAGSVLMTSAFASAQTESAATKTEAEIVKERTRSRYVLSAHGPGAGNSAMGASATFIAFLPTLDVRWVHGLGSVVDFDVQIWALFLYRADAGVRVRLFDGDNVSFALRGGAQALYAHTGSHQIADVHLKPGALVSFGSDSMAATVSVHAPFRLPGEYKNIFERFDHIEASVGVEFEAIQSANLLIEAKVLVPTAQSEVFLPILTVGGAM